MKLALGCDEIWYMVRCDSAVGEVVSCDLGK